METRPEYSVQIIVNDRNIRKVYIDQHYKVNHSDSMSDEIILDLVQELHGKSFSIEAVRGSHQYFKAEPVYREDRPYRIILVLCIEDEFLGVINAFRVEDKRL